MSYNYKEIKISSSMTHNVRYLRWQGIEARHALTKVDLFSVAEVKNFCLALFVMLELKLNRITNAEPAIRRPLQLQILLLCLRACLL